MLHILKSPLNSSRTRCYKVRYIALAILRTEKFKISDAKLLTGRESQVCVSHLPVEVGFLPFYEHRFFELHLVFNSCRVQDLKKVRCVGYSARL